jgi:hypothetical protein
MTRWQSDDWLAVVQLVLIVAWAFIFAGDML